MLMLMFGLDLSGQVPEALTAMLRFPLCFNRPRRSAPGLLPSVPFVSGGEEECSIGIENGGGNRQAPVANVASRSPAAGCMYYLDATTGAGSSIAASNIITIRGGGGRRKGPRWEVVVAPSPQFRDCWGNRGVR